MNKNLFKTAKPIGVDKLDVKVMFPQNNDYSWFQHPDYEDLVAKMCDEVVLGHSDSDYQGSSYYMVRKGEQYGYIEFGWGSCSGCDAMQACENYDDLQSLFDRLNDSIQWFNTREEFWHWCMHEHDWEGSYSWHDGAKEFVKKVQDYYQKVYDGK